MPRIIVSAILLLAAAPAHGESLTVSFNTTTTGACYEPRNATVVWVEDGSGQFVKTLGRWANRYKDELVTWWAASGQDLDGETGASRSSHSTRLTATWDMTDDLGGSAPDGTYSIRFEMTECNNGSNENVWAQTFEKNGDTWALATSGNGFTGVDFGYTGRVPDSPGVIELASASYSVPEDIGVVTLEVTRAGGTAGVVDVSFTTGEGTATAGEDFVTTAGTLTFNDGESQPKMITVVIEDDSAVEAPESLLVTLQSPTNGAALGAVTDAEIEILDDDSASGPLNDWPQLDDGQLNDATIIGYSGCRAASTANAAVLVFFLLVMRNRRRD